MTVPIRWRLTLFNALVIGAILVVLGFALFFLLRQTLLSSVEDAARDRALAVARSVEIGEGLEESDGGLVLDDDLVDAIVFDGVFIVVRDAEGNVIAETVDLPAGREARDEVWRVALEAGRPAYGTVEFTDEGGPDYVYAVPVRPAEGGPARVVEAGKSYEQAAENVRALAFVLAFGIGVAFLLSVGGAYLLACAALSPVSAVVKAARRIAEGDLSKRLPVAHPKDEIGDLTTTINAMLSRLEGAFARLEEALARQHRFAADASHELRTPLTSINGYAQVLEEWGLKDPNFAPEGVAAIKRESERMKGLVENLLILTRGDEDISMNLERADVSQVAEEAVKAARAASGGKVGIEYEPPEDEIYALLDQERVRQALSILLDNAVKYTPVGGWVEVEVKDLGETVAVKVSDTGTGIPADALSHVFERFYRVDEAREDGGVGLGLSIARQIADAHEARIEVESEPDEGSTFTLLLPRKNRNLK
ncbi:MAG: HAMP domain-containing protein [Rubrobacter sp.]|nr:HAMP domain-containing protein [Rubrobacter sp.]